MEVSGRARAWQHPGAVCLGEGGGVTRVGGKLHVRCRTMFPVVTVLAL